MNNTATATAKEIVRRPTPDAPSSSSVKYELTFQYCNEHGVAMVITGIRHFKH